MHYGIQLICFVGAAVRLLFYRIFGKKDITMEFLLGKKDEQQLTSLAVGVLLIFLIVFTIVRLV